MASSEPSPSHNSDAFAGNTFGGQRPRDAALHFAKYESAFHLGFLPTERPHPVTSDLSHVARRNPATAVDRILQVDGDIAAVARRAVLSPEFGKLVAAMRGVADGRGSVIFSGCGSTGRLAIILEAMWRRARAGSSTADSTASIMTGGDRALIRAVEHFEDYEQFGRRQVADLNIDSDDVFIGISEGGETSSVIGTVREAAARGASTFFLYNNPTSLLRAHIERSRRVIDDPRVTCIDLFSGAMALSGSTRMQATTLEMLVCGIAMEEALGSSVPRLDRVDAFARLLRSLREPISREAIGRIASLEAEIYSDSGLVTYYADNFLLDIFSDTTERSPTFMLPPLRPAHDRQSPPAWAFPKDSHLESGSAWTSMLGRPVRGIRWDAADYRAMHAPADLIETPPKLDAEEIHSYRIGNEPDPSRTDSPRSVAIRAGIVGAGGHSREPDAAPDLSAFHEQWRLEIVPIHQTKSLESAGEGVIRVPAEIPDSPVALFHHLAVKLVFNTFSTTSMALLGRIHGNWMIQLNPTNKKLIDRGTRIIAHLASIEYTEACIRLHEAMAGKPSSTLDRGKPVDDTSAATPAPPQQRGDDATESPVVIALRRLGVLEARHPERT